MTAKISEFGSRSTRKSKSLSSSPNSVLTITVAFTARPAISEILLKTSTGRHRRVVKDLSIHSRSLTALFAACSDSCIL